MAKKIQDTSKSSEKALRQKTIAIQSDKSGSVLKRLIAPRHRSSKKKLGTLLKEQVKIIIK